MCTGSTSAYTMGTLNFAQTLFGGMEKQQQQQQYYASALQSYYNAQANWEINKRQADDAKRMRDAAARIQLLQLEAAQQEANDAATEQKIEIVRELMRAKEQAKAAAGEANVSGNGVQRILSDIGFTEQAKLGAVEASRANQVSALQAEKLGVVNATDMAPIYAAIGDKPKYAGNSILPWLSAGLSGLTGYMNYATTPFQRDQVSQTSSTAAIRNPALILTRR